MGRSQRDRVDAGSPSRGRRGGRPASGCSRRFRRLPARGRSRPARSGLHDRRALGLVQAGELAGGAGDPDPVHAAREHVLDEAAQRLEVDLLIVRQRGEDRGDDAAQLDRVRTPLGYLSLDDTVWRSLAEYLLQRAAELLLAAASSA